MCGGSTNTLGLLHSDLKHKVTPSVWQELKLFRSFFSIPFTMHTRTGKQFSLDSRMDLVFHGLEGGRSEPGDKNHAITEDGEESWEGTKGRYCAMIIYRKHLDVVRDSL